MDTLTLVEVGKVPAAPLRPLASLVGLATGFGASWGEGTIDPAPARDSARSQYDSRLLLASLAEAYPRGRVVGITDGDLYSTVFTFVFGEAQLDGRVAIVSLHRLAPERYGLPADPMRLQQRVVKEALHEIGHLLGLRHCRAPACVMGFSGTVEEIDDKGSDYCDPCLDLVVKARDQGA